MLELPKKDDEAVSLLMAITRLQGSNLDFKRLTDWLKENNIRLSEANKYEKDNTNLQWKQGAMQILDSIEYFCNRGRALVEKYRAKEKEKQF